ncbi:UrcA family protein [Erythrobacter arachoides]|uniref:UrcA family protein n=1 Tax=Aurantiacibacter arachoides TaxID=1850444 RepID=A0A845A5D1_9SPHN|nr:UrcA family protein [Aurantiacibacter arachoides]MXO94622.1 UrcA family protein [Aurantiacibacter arachoides]GGD62021.1 hypothetical protein GCM10011411_22830 [Aurantiacibacter arachoides]
MFNQTLTIAAAIALTSTALSPAASAATQPADQATQISVRVAYDDLDLGSDAGQAELARRLERSARHICATRESDPGSRIRSRHARACYDSVMIQYEGRFAAIVADRQRGG